MKNNIFKRIAVFIISAVIMLVQMMLIYPTSAGAEEKSETIGAENQSGTLGNITWKYCRDDFDDNLKLFISGEGNIPTIEELGLEEYPWAEFGVRYIVIEDGITSIPADFCDSTILSIDIPNSMECISTGAFNGLINTLMMTVYSYDCVFEENLFSTADDSYILISAYNDSTAIEYAQENGFEYISLGEKIFGTYSDGALEYTLYKDYAVVSAVVSNVSSVTILSEVEGRTVEKIKSKAFLNCEFLTSVTIPDSVIKIGNGAFKGCTSLTDVNLPDSIINMESIAFEGCTSLKSIIIPDSIIEISSSVFKDCSSLEEIKLPDGLIKIGPCVFYGCASLTAVDIPDSVKYIGREAFKESGLVSVKLPEDITVLGDYAFADCYNLTELNFPESIKKLDYSVIINVPTDALKFPENMDIVIDEWAYKKSNEDEADVSVPESVTTLYFNSYTGYSSLDIGKNLRNFNVPELDDYPCFEEVLKEINISAENPYLCSDNGVIYNKDKTEIIYVVPGYQFENGIMTIPATVKKLPCAITNYNIESFVVEEGNTEFSVIDGILYDAEKKTLLAYPVGKNGNVHYVPDGTEVIAKGAFYQLGVSAEVIDIPESVKRIEQGAFWKSVLECIIFRHSSTAVLEIAEDFEGHYTSFGAFVDNNAVYYSHEGTIIESKFPKQFKLLNITGSGSCGENLKWEMKGVDLVISGTGKMTEYSRGEYPWSSLFFLNLKFEGSDIEIAEQAFYNIRCLYTLDLSGVTRIGNLAFKDCRKLNNIAGHDDVVMIGSDSFLNTKWIDNVNDNDYIKILGSVLARYAGNSETAEIPDNITYVANNAFLRSGCKTLYIPKDGVFYELQSFASTSIEHVRYKGIDEDIPLSEFRDNVSECTTETFTDESGNTFTGLAIDSRNSLMTLACALGASPYMINMYRDYCYNIVTRCTDDMTDQQLITVLYNYMKTETTYGSVYAEDSSGEYKIGDVSYGLCRGVTNKPTGMLIFGRGVCTSYAEIVDLFVTIINEEGISDTISSVRATGLNHEWNAVGLEVGTENEKWYYMDLSNGIYLIGYENGVLSSNPEMFSYDAELEPNEDGTYTITLTSGKVINIQSADAEFAEVKGDINGDGSVSIDDATAVLTMYAGIAAGMETTGNTAAADVDGNGTVDIADAVAILTYYAQYSAGMNPDWNELLEAV